MTTLTILLAILCVIEFIIILVLIYVIAKIRSTLVDFLTKGILNKGLSYLGGNLYSGKTDFPHNLKNIGEEIDWQDYAKRMYEKSQELKNSDKTK